MIYLIDLVFIYIITIVTTITITITTVIVECSQLPLNKMQYTSILVTLS